MFNIIKNLWKNNLETNNKIDDNIEINTISRPWDLEVSLKNFDKLIEEKNFDTVKDYIKFLSIGMQTDLVNNCSHNDFTYKNYIDNIKYSFILDQSKVEVKNVDLLIKIPKIPVISCVWRTMSIISCLKGIGKVNKNPFDGIGNSFNIKGFLIEPLGFVVVYAGNHSVNSAIIHDEGEIKISTCIDKSNILDLYFFDGKQYRYTENNNIINNNMLKNNSEPFLYSMGLLFEMTKILNKYKVNMIDKYDCIKYL